mgnify:CR=1 FL=1
MDADPIYLEPQGYSVIWPVLGFFIIFGLLVWAVWIWLLTRPPESEDGSGSLPPAALLKDMDALLMTEVLEYALALAPTPKGHEAYAGIPALAPYKLALAVVYDELGDAVRAKKYCEALAAASRATKTQMHHPALLSELHQLSSRLHRQQLNGGDGSSWVGRKLSRPTLDGMWGALEGRLTKFIAGEEEGAEKQEPVSSGERVGAFTHYSAITPDMAGSLDALSRSDGDGDAQETTFAPEAYAEGYAAEAQPDEYVEGAYDEAYPPGDPTEAPASYAGEQAEIGRAHV